MDNKSKENMSFEDKIIADDVADEILTVNTEKQDRRYFILLLLFLLGLIFLVSSISFAVFDTYFNGSDENAIKVGIDIGVDEDKDKDKVKDEDKTKDDEDEKRPSSTVDKEDGTTGGSVSGPTTGGDSSSDDDSSDTPDDDPSIDPGSVLFTFNEGSNYINMTNVFPLSDEEGKNLTGDKQYFDFNVAAELSSDSTGTLVYEISLVPISGNTIANSDVRVYLTENGKEVSVLNNMVNNVSSLPNSKYREGGKVLFRKSVTSDYRANYIFRMWLSNKANVGEKVKRFGCKIVVDAYYE